MRLKTRLFGFGIPLAGLLAFSFCHGDESPTASALAICPDPTAPPHVLPYAPPGSYLCSQGYIGYKGPWPHPPEFRFAVDFNMLIGTVVTAARDGIVEFVEARFPDGNSGPETDNVVVIDHGDGTFSRYAHLTQNGALVRRGQSVRRGDPVGRSGSSGTLFPHLHFDVTRVCSTRECQTLPVCFSNTIAHPHGLETGVFYPAFPF